jgi:uroporphyrinogen-III synthase
MRRVWVTRAQPGADETAARVRAMGLEAVVEPLLEVRPVGEGPLDLVGVGAVAFTSANAVRAFAVRSARRDLPIFAVGAATAEAARDAGFATIQSAAGDVAALGRLILSRAESLDGSILHAAAAEPAGDLVGVLLAGGASARSLPLYETTVRAPAPRTRDVVAGGAIVLAHSPRAARALGAWVEDRDVSRLTALCLSPAVAAPLTGAPLAEVRAADAPTEAALMTLLAGYARRL